MRRREVRRKRRATDAYLLLEHNIEGLVEFSLDVLDALHDVGINLAASVDNAHVCDRREFTRADQYKAMTKASYAEGRGLGSGGTHTLLQRARPSRG